MIVYTYDKNFEGFLTCIFESYNRKEYPVDIYPRGGKTRYLYAELYDVTTDSGKADRVWKGIQEKLTRKNKQLLFYAFLSDEPGIEMKIYRFVRRLFIEHYNIETDFGDADVLCVTQISRKVKKEAMRMMQFVRFQRTREDFFFCGIEPIYDVIPLVVNHFQSRFSDQKWLLYDLKRNYGIYYNLIKAEEVELSKQAFNQYNGEVQQNILQEGEGFYQSLWKSYFKHININERKNLKLQLQHMPRRFWKYLPEKVTALR